MANPHPEEKLFPILKSLHGVLKHADGLNVHFHDVAIVNRRNAGCCPRKQDVARVERHAAGQITDQIGHGKNQFLCVGSLADFAVDAHHDIQMRRIQIGFNPRANRRKSVETLANAPLIGRALHIARRHIIAAGVAQHIIQSFFLRDKAGLFPDDDNKLSFMLYLPCI